MSAVLADLHIHSYYSDGTMSPGEIVSEAKRRNVGLIAVCDHSKLEGSREIAKLCADNGIGYISGVEIDSLDGEIDHHILGYGADIYEPRFVRFIKRNRELLDEISIKLIKGLKEDFPEVTPGDYEAFTYDRRLGGWKCMHYLIHKGLADSFRDVRRIYDDYDCPFSAVDFPSIPKVCEEVRKAGGRAVLAHPGETMKHLDIEAFRRQLERLACLGIDGVECYYPTHGDEVTAECLKLCREKGLLITAGSDCHGSFKKTYIGEIKATLDMLNLNGLAW